jgi:hypothetical protein
MQALVLKDRIRIKEFFIDFDKLRKGFVGEAAVSNQVQFRRPRSFETECFSYILSFSKLPYMDVFFAYLLCFCSSEHASVPSTSDLRRVNSSRSSPSILRPTALSTTLPSVKILIQSLIIVTKTTQDQLLNSQLKSRLLLLISLTP